MKPLTLIITGRQGSGKSTTYNYLKKVTNHNFVKTVTTRPPRDTQYETDYKFVSNKDYKYLLQTGKLLESRAFSFGIRTVHYGTLKQDYLPNKVSVIACDNQRALDIAHYTDALILYISASPHTRTTRVSDTRLNYNQREQEEDIRYKDFDKIVLNRTLSDNITINSNLLQNPNFQTNGSSGVVLSTDGFTPKELQDAIRYLIQYTKFNLERNWWQWNYHI